MSSFRLRLGVRARLLLAVVLAVAAALVAVIVAFNVVLANRLSANATDRARARASAQLAALRIVKGRLVSGEGPAGAALESPVWIFQGSQLVEEPTGAEADDTNAARTLASSGRDSSDDPDHGARLAAVPIVISGQKLGTVVAGVSLGPYAETQKTALIGSLILGGVLLTAVALAARWLLAAALRPVARMTSDADRWSERDLDRRFALGEPHDELTTLAATLDRLLDRLAASLRHEQRFTAELSHELRTPLAKITAESELALRRARSNDEYRTALDVIKRSADQMARTVDTLVAAARQETGLSRSTADAGAAAAAAHQACAKLAEEQRITLELDAPQAQFRVGVDGDLVERILQPLIENACRYASTRAHTTVSRNNTGVLLTVEDDGPGLSTDELERIFEPGVRGTASEKSRGAAGAGLGLALSRRLARAAGGDVEARPGTTGGCFVVWLPAA